MPTDKPRDPEKPAGSKAPTDPARVRGFATFFKRYMSVSTIVVAALPIPAGYVVPSFASQSTTLSLYTSMYCFLALGFIFFIRHKLARLMFAHQIVHPGRTPKSDPLVGLRRAAVTITPLLCIAVSLYATYKYHSTLDANVQYIQTKSGPVEQPGELTGEEERVRIRLEGEWKRLVQANRAELANDAGTDPRRDDDTWLLPGSYILQHAGTDAIVDDAWLLLWYLLTFLSAEAAFILMALKEYLQDLLGVSDIELIRQHRNVTEEDAKTPSAESIEPRPDESGDDSPSS